MRAWSIPGSRTSPTHVAVPATIGGIVAHRAIDFPIDLCTG